jgi:2-polyprenyl-3-methyl-5-hydroxy-6-metoxy-1,4-benzoquinol methylase
MNSSHNSKKINFDNYANNYENEISKNLVFFENDLNYYYIKKVEILKNELRHDPKNILDFGSGIGALSRHLINKFPKSNIFAHDESKKSLDLLKKNIPKINCLYNLNINQKFDLILLSNVIHHVKSSDRNKLFKKLFSLLETDGILFIFEHNPYNPITLRIVANCEFDADAELIKKKELIKILSNNNFIKLSSGYIHFFPSNIGFMFKFEKLLKWFFLGAQYFCMFKKNQTNK